MCSSISTIPFSMTGTHRAGVCGAMARLSRAGLSLIPVTGRPAGWGEVMARQWPVAAVMTENGAVAFWREGGRLERWEQAEEATRRGRRFASRGRSKSCAGDSPKCALGRRHCAVSDFDHRHRRIAEIPERDVCAPSKP